MAILDLIRNYGNRQVVRQKDKAIIELAENGGGNNAKLDANFFKCGNFPSGEVGADDIPNFNDDKILLRDDDNYKYFGNLAFTPSVFYFSLLTEEIEERGNLWAYLSVQHISNITESISADIVFKDVIPDDATLCLFKATKEQRILHYPSNRDRVYLELIAYTTETPK